MRARDIYHTGAEEEQFHGLYISEQEIEALTGQREAIVSAESATEFLEDCKTLSGIEGLSASWQLSAFDHAVLLVALAPEVDLRYERICAYLQDDVTRRRPTVDLALNLLSRDPSEKIANRARFSASAPLVRSGMLRLLPDASHAEPPLLAHYLRLDESVVWLLLGDGRLDDRLASFCEVLSGMADSGLQPEMLPTLLPSMGAHSDGHAVRLHFSGPAASLKSGVIQAVAGSLGTPLLAADLARTSICKTDPAAVALLLTREASRMDAVLHVDGLDEISDPAILRAFLEGILQYSGMVTVASVSPAVAALLASEGFVTLACPLPAYEERRACWEKKIAAAGLIADDSTTATLANHFTRTAAQIEAAVDTARQSIEWQWPGNHVPCPDDVTQELMKAVRAQTGAELESLTQKLRPIYRWQDIVLPQDSVDQLREICQRVAHSHAVLERGGFGKKLSTGMGVAALFAGPSGTGKTMAAEVVANELGLDLYRIDLSMVVSKYIGETEKNLERIFTAATHSNCVLLFDEADALCGKRSEVRDAHDRYANIEISYLLQKMEQYEGITILTTNLRGNVDEAFVRRLAFTVHFPFPEESDRLRIWQQIWPEETPLEPDLDFATLAKHFKLSGGNIKNIALATAFLAAAESRPVRMGDILHATRREYEKVGKVLSAAEMEAVIH